MFFNDLAAADTEKSSKPFVFQTGSGMHVHLSLYDKNNNNIFENIKEEGSEQLAHSIAGLQNTTYESCSTK